MQFSDLDLTKTYTYADYLKWTFDERLELIKGHIFTMSPAPAEFHQRILTTVGNEIYNHLKRKSCKVYFAPFDVRLVRKSLDDKQITTVVQPDICVICDLKKIDKNGCLGAPDIVVEILSPGNNKKELQNKYEVYEEAGVKEYWIIQPGEKTFFKYVLDDNGRYQPTKLLTLGDNVTSTVLPDFVLSLDEVFADLFDGNED
ncbi:MAG: Uma2 family endonuclease [Sphingobacteriaceae bacterium]|nr:MAG: Uma2 family endonuclease [Sphingobacteriaceae bacterium]